MNNDYYGVIYKLTNKINNKIYIGQTKTKPPIKRFYSHVYFSKSNNKMIISRAINKYGKSNFSFEIIEYCFSQEQLNQKEGFYIKKYNSNNLSLGYNLNDIIDGKWKHSNQTKEKLSKIKRTKKYLDISSNNGKKTKNTKLKNNSSIYIGVSKRGNKWCCSTKHNNKHVYLGVYDSEIDAAYAKDIFELNNFNEYSILNFPELKEKYLNGEINPIRSKLHDRIQKDKKSDSKIVGVSYSNIRKRWCFDRKGYKFKCFKTKEEAEKHAELEYKTNQ